MHHKVTALIAPCNITRKERNLEPFIKIYYYYQYYITVLPSSGCPWWMNLPFQSLRQPTIVWRNESKLKESKKPLKESKHGVHIYLQPEPHHSLTYYCCEIAYFDRNHFHSSLVASYPTSQYWLVIVRKFSDQWIWHRFCYEWTNFISTTQLQIPQIASYLLKQ